MKKRIWGTLDDYLPPFQGSSMVGRGFANHNFIRALFEYSSFDEYHFFLNNLSQRKLFLTHHAEVLKSLGVTDRVKLFYRTELARAMTNHDYTVFHQSDHLTHFSALCHFRNLHGAFPVTAFIHSISYPDILLKLQDMCWAGLQAGDAIICSSTCGREVLQNYWGQIRQERQLNAPPLRLELLPFGFDARAFAGLEKESARRELALPLNDTVALCLGRFSEFDKMDLFPLLQAFQQVHRPNWRLVLAGAVNQPDYLSMVKVWIKALGLQDSVTIVTDLSEGDKLKLYRAADFFISPSDNLQETFGLTLVEALAAGLPLIVSDFNGYRDIVTDELALKIPTRWAPMDVFSDTSSMPFIDKAMAHRYLAQSVQVDIDAMALAMKRLYTDPGLRQEMGQAARQRFEACYDYQRIIKRIEALWIDLSDNFKSHPTPKAGKPLYPDYFHAFGHYFTDHLSTDACVTCTDYALALLESQQHHPLLTDMEQLVDTDTVAKIMDFTRTPKSIADIMNNCCTDKENLLYQILWMLKHGLLRLSPNPPHRK